MTKTPVDRRIMLDPLETIEFLVQQRDSTGGSGANFIIDWLTTELISEPVIEAVMVGTSGTQAIALRASGRTITSSSAAP